MTLKVTEKTIARFIATLYEKQAQKYGGETSLNELRTIAQVYYFHTEEGRGTSVTELANSLDIASSTVHRAVTRLIDKGWLTDAPHPDDGRRRIVQLSDQGVSGGLWAQGIQWIEAYSEEV